MKKYIPKTKEEAEYIAKYDPTKYYPNPAVTADIAVYAFDDTINALKLLLIERGGFPYKGDMALPGGFMDIDESLEEAVARELLEETGIIGVDAYMHCIMSEVGRDPRQRVLTPEYIALTNIHDIIAKAGDDAAKADWYEIAEFKETVSRDKNTLIKRYDMLLKCSYNEILLSAESAADYTERQPKRSFRIIDDGNMAFDHAEAILKSFISLRERLKTTDIACGALGRRFCKEAYNDLMRAAKLGTDFINPSLYSDGEELSLLPEM